MNEKALDALHGSIVHWKNNKRAEHPRDANITVNGCALCEVYNIPVPENDKCEGCPVAKKAGAKFCKETPYGYVFLAFHKWRFYVDVNDTKKQKEAIVRWQSAVQNMIDYLEDLLPEEHEPRNEA